MRLQMNAADLSAYVSEIFPQSDKFRFTVEKLEVGMVEVRMAIEETDLRPGGTVSGPSMFALADCASYLLVLAHVGKVALAVTTNLNINFLNRPEAADLIAKCSFLKLGKRLLVCDIAIYSAANDVLVAHATATYSLPPDR